MFYEKILENGCFFITICTNKRMPIFACEVNEPNILSAEGIIAKRCIVDMPTHFSHVIVDEYVVMPDHVHLIIGFTKNISSHQVFSKPKPGSLVTVIKSYKSAVTRAMNLLPNYQDYKVWQSGYYEHRIRNYFDLQATRQYIRNNPVRWEQRYLEV